MGFGAILGLILMTFGLHKVTREGKGGILKNLVFLRKTEVFEGRRLHFGGENRRKTESETEPDSECDFDGFWSILGVILGAETDPKRTKNEVEFGAIFGCDK